MQNFPAFRIIECFRNFLRLIGLPIMDKNLIEIIDVSGYYVL